MHYIRHTRVRRSYLLFEGSLHTIRLSAALSHINLEHRFQKRVLLLALAASLKPAEHLTVFGSLKICRSTFAKSLEIGL